jgi:hypothetical protein
MPKNKTQNLEGMVLYICDSDCCNNFAYSPDPGGLLCQFCTQKLGKPVVMRVADWDEELKIYARTYNEDFLRQTTIGVLAH